MKQIPTWQTPKTSRVLLHPTGSQRLVTVYPDMKITDLDLRDIGWHYNQPGFGVHLILGEEPGDPDMEKTVWKKPTGGLPVYTLYNQDPNGCAVTMTAFCDTARIPASYGEITVRNENNYPVTGAFGLLPRYNAKDHYLTGLHDTGYEPYNPSVNQWYLSWQNAFAPLEGDPLCAAAEDGYGAMRILSSENTAPRWISRTEQPNRFLAHDYYRFDYMPSNDIAIQFRKDGKWYYYKGGNNPREASLAAKSLLMAPSIGRALVRNGQYAHNGPRDKEGRPDPNIGWWGRSHYNPNYKKG